MLRRSVYAPVYKRAAFLPFHFCDLIFQIQQQRQRQRQQQKIYENKTQKYECESFVIFGLFF